MTLLPLQGVDMICDTTPPQGVALGYELLPLRGVLKCSFTAAKITAMSKYKGKKSAPLDGSRTDFSGLKIHVSTHAACHSERSSYRRSD